MAVDNRPTKGTGGQAGMEQRPAVDRDHHAKVTMAAKKMEVLAVIRRRRRVIHNHGGQISSNKD